jgi:hypothetical protein
MFEKFDRLNNLQKAGIYFGGIVGAGLLSLGLATNARNHMENQFDPFKDQGTIPETILKVEIFEAARNISGKLSTLRSGLSINDPFYTKKFVGIRDVCQSEPLNLQRKYNLPKVEGLQRVEMYGGTMYFNLQYQDDVCKDLLVRYQVLTERLDALNTRMKNSN